VTTPRKRFGDSAERVAAAFLERQGWTILHRNWRRPGGEIDLIALDGDTLVFVEVRARRSTAFGSALESITSVKRGRLLAAIGAFEAEHPHLVNDRRVDVVTVDRGPRGMVVERIENAIEGD
jgi:putative endonuclease